MPQKLNKAGQMQDYIPKGNGDASGEYGTSNGTNKNFTTSDKKKTKANVITENKSVVVGDKGKAKEKPFDIDTLDVSLRKKVESGEITLKDASRELAKAGWYNFIPSEEETKKALGIKDNKANVIDGDLSGKGNTPQEAYDLLNSDNIESIEYTLNWNNTASGRNNLTINKTIDDKNKFLGMLDATVGSNERLKHNKAFSHEINYMILKVKEKGHRAKEVKVAYEDLIKLNNKITGKRVRVVK